MEEIREYPVATNVVKQGTLGKIAQRRNKQGRVFTIETREPRQDPDAVTGTFPINHPYASISNTGINLNLACLELKKLLGLVSSKIDVPYSLEMGIQKDSLNSRSD